MVGVKIKSSRRFIILLFLIIMSYSMYSQEIKKYICNGWGIDVYEDADITSNVVAHIPFGESVLIKAETDIQVQSEGEGYWWKKISFNNVTGYVSSKWLVNSFETAVKVRRVEGTWIRDKGGADLFPPDNKFISLIYLGKGDEPSFVVNNETTFFIERERRFLLTVDKMGLEFPERDEDYSFNNYVLKCSAICFKFKWEFDKDGNPIDYPKELSRWQDDYYYRKINFHEDFDSVYRLKSDYKTYRTIASEIFKIYDNPNLSGRIASVIGPGTAIEVIDVPERNGEALAGWVKVAVLKPLKTGGYEKTDLVGWCYWEQ